MFVQIIQAKATHPESIRTHLERWLTELAPGADGWVGSTSGVTRDGTVIALACFENAEAARRNSDRPEQGQWWAEMEKLFEGPATFEDTDDVIATFDGDSYVSAGFVQVMKGKAVDVEAIRSAVPSPDNVNLNSWREFRPEILGELTMLQPDGSYTVAVYFTSEDAAREGEKKEPPPELQADLERMGAAQGGDIQFFDLHWPWVFVPATS